MAHTYTLGFGRKLINAVAKPAIRLGLAPKGSHLLTTVGRKTGRRHTTPVHIVERDEQRYLTAPYGVRPWVLNARAAGEVTLTRGRRSVDYGVAEVDAAEAGPVLRDYVRQIPVVRPYFEATKVSPVNEFEREAAAHPVFRLTPR